MSDQRYNAAMKRLNNSLKVAELSFLLVDHSQAAVICTGVNAEFARQL